MAQTGARGEGEMSLPRSWYSRGMTNTEIAYRRLRAQRLTQPDLAAPGDVARWFGAVQAQEFRHALYAVGLRMPPTATEVTVERAIAEKSIIRTWPMRGTIHFIPPEDARWMLKLLARRTNGKAASIYRRAGLTEAAFAQAGEVLAETLRGGKVLPRQQLYDALEASGIATGSEQRGLHMLGYWAREGLLCLGPHHGKQPTFTLLDEWIPPARALEGEETLATLARRYFVSHGPATVYDFAWWTGLTLTEARLAVQLVAQDLTRETMDGQTYWASSAHGSSALPGSTAYLLPPYDELTVAYKDRSAVLGPDAPSDPFVILGPVVVLDGRVVGSWKRTLLKGEVVVTLRAFASLGDEQRATVEQAAQRYGAFIGLPARVEW